MNENITQEVKEVIVEYQEKLKQLYLEQENMQLEAEKKLIDLNLDVTTALELLMEATIETTTTTVSTSKDDYELAMDLIKMGLPED